MQFHILSLEGPDPYARVGGLATRADGLVRTLAGLGIIPAACTTASGTSTRSTPARCRPAWSTGFSCPPQSVANTQGLERSAVITTVSRYMKHQMAPLGVEVLIVPNGLSADAFQQLPRGACAALRRCFSDRTVVVKMARRDPDKRWIAAVETVAEMKRVGWRPLLVARGGTEPHGGEVLSAMAAHDLNRIDQEFLGLFARLRAAPGEARAIRYAGQLTARRFSWTDVVQRVLLPRLALASGAPLTVAI